MANAQQARDLARIVGQPVAAGPDPCLRRSSKAALVEGVDGETARREKRTGSFKASGVVVEPVHGDDHGVRLTDFTVAGDVARVRFDRVNPETRAEESETWERQRTETIGGRLVSVFQPSWRAESIQVQLARSAVGLDRPLLYLGSYRGAADAPSVERYVYLRVGTSLARPVEIVRVDDTGLATAVANGTATITAQVDDVTGDAPATVCTQPLPISISAGQYAEVPVGCPLLIPSGAPADRYRVAIVRLSAAAEAAAATATLQMSARPPAPAPPPAAFAAIKRRMQNEAWIWETPTDRGDLDKFLDVWFSDESVRARRALTESLRR